MTETADRDAAPQGRRLHPLPVRIMHWLNALAILIMIGSGWSIYNDKPLFGWLRFPALLTIGGDPGISFKLNGDSGFGGALQWHFAAMWLLVLNGLGYIAYGVLTGRFRQMLLPIRPREIFTELRDALHFRLEHGDVRVYNAVQKLSYLGIILAVAVQVTTGLALWKPVQFSGLVTLLHDFQGVRLAHFVGMGAICAFLIVHVALTLIVPRTLIAMVTGGPKLDNPAAAQSASTPGMAPQAGA